MTNTKIAVGAVGSDELVSDADSLLKVSGGDIVNSGGFIGIGTDSPDTMLEIATAESASGLNGSYGDIRITDSEPQIEFIDDELEDFAIHVNNSKMYFINEPWDKIMVLDSGKVGIGTDAPDALLEIETVNSTIGLDGGGEFRISDPSPQIDFVDAEHEDFAIHVNDDRLRFISEDWDSNHLVLYNGNVGIQTSTPNFTLTVIGTAYCTSGSWTASDARYKENITPIQSSLEKLSKIDGVNFTWKPEFQEELHVSEGSQIGLIAQDVEKEFPELVNTDPTGYKAVAYDKFTAVLLQAIKGQQVMIEAQQVFMEAQQEQIDEMNEKLDRLLE